MKNNIKFLALMLVSLSALPVLQAAPNTEGQWSPMIDWPFIPIHTVMTPQGSLLTWGLAGASTDQFQYDVWDPTQGTAATSHNTLTSTLGVTSFCSSGLVLAESGNILMPGGDGMPDATDRSGIASVPLFNTQSNSLSSAADMSYSRWYPTTITLANGDILVSGGRDENFRPAYTSEVYSPATNTWRSLLGFSNRAHSWHYPRLWVIPDGRIFGTSNGKVFYMSAEGQGTITYFDDLPLTSRGIDSSSVMYQPGKILQIGGSSGTSPNGAILVDANVSPPKVRTISALTEGRIWTNVVVLPNGKVMAAGGYKKGDPNIYAYGAEIWDPATEQWSMMAKAQTVRNYHSTAILLKDGRVLSSGNTSPGGGQSNGEIFSPPYLFNSTGLAPRPVIGYAPEEAPYGEKILVTHSAGQAISRVTLIKTGAVTHSINMEQRFIELDFTDNANGLEVALPESANVATPGHYLLFLINNKGVPSEGHIVRISTTAEVVLPDYPTAVGDSVSASAGNSTTIIALSNDSGTGLSVTDFNLYSKEGGSITKSGNKLIYFPSPSYNGEDSFWYQITDAFGRTNSAKIAITVSGGNLVNPHPVGKSDSATATVAAITIDVLANDVGTGLVLDALNPWSLEGGKVAMASNKIVYTSKSGFNGQDKIWYTFKDVEGRHSWGEVTITVNNGAIDNPVPVGKADSVDIPVNSTISIDVLSNDTGSNLVLEAPSVWSLKGGTVSTDSNLIIYNPAADFSGQDKIWYTFKDQSDRSSWAEVTINVQGSALDFRAETNAAASNSTESDTDNNSGGGSQNIIFLLMLFSSGLLRFCKFGGRKKYNGLR